MLPTRTSCLGSVLRHWLAAGLAITCPSVSIAAPVLDQEAVYDGNPSGLVGFSNSLTRAQTFTVGIGGTLALVELKVSGAATATFEIHPTTNGLPVLGSQALGAAVVTFDTPSLGPPIHVVADFTPAGIEVEVGDVLAIVMQPGAFTVSPTNTPFWHRLNSAYRYEEGSYYSTNSLTPTTFVDFVPSDAGFRTWVEPAPTVQSVPFDPDDRRDRLVALYPETTPCLTTGTNGIADASCTTYAGGVGPLFEAAPLAAALSWAGDVATLTVSPEEVETYLTETTGVAPSAMSSLTLRFDVVSGDIVGGALGGGPSDWFLQADLPTPHGTLTFDWLNRTQMDRPFEGTVLVGTAFEKQVVATCATEGDAPAPAVANGVCFLQQHLSPGFDLLTSTLTAYAHRDAAYPIEDYSPEFDTLDFAIAELAQGAAVPVVPGLGSSAQLLLALLLASLGVAFGRSAQGSPARAARSHVTSALSHLSPLAIVVLATGLLPTGSARAAEFGGTLELSVSESFGTSSAPPTWHGVLRTADGRHPLPDSAEMSVYSHGQRVVVEGALVDGVLLPSSISVARGNGVEPAPALDEGTQKALAAFRTPVVPASETLGAQSTLVTLLNFTNDTSQPYTTTQVTDWLLDETEPTSTASYIREVSYGRAWLSGGVVGWLPLGYDDTDCELWTNDGVLDLIFAMDPLINFASVDRWVIVIPPNANCGFVGISTLGKEVRTTADGVVEFSRIIMNGLDASSSAVGAHELGHSMGALQHSADYECGLEIVDDDCSPGETGTDEFDIMGSPGLAGHYSAPNKEALHWLHTNLIEVTGAGGTYFIEPYESLSTGIKVLRIPVPWSIDEIRGASAYYLSYRTQTGFDAGFSEFATDGALVHLDGDFFQENDPAATGASLLLDTTPGSVPDQIGDSADALLAAGQTFVDTVHGISIEVVGMNGAHLEVEVLRSQYCGNSTVDASLGEACDGTDLQSETCQSLGWTSGPLVCGASCGFDYSACGAPVCGVGHDYDPVGDSCTARLSLDPAVRALWRNAVTWSDVRNQTWASAALDHYASFRLYNHQTIDRSWIYRTSLPFDTSSIPDSATVLSADLNLRALTGTYLFENSHPASGDQLVLVQPALVNPPTAEPIDFGAFGSLDNPVEGARVDIGDIQTASDFDVQLDLNASGLSWIDPTGMTVFGLRGGYDVDDITIPGEEPVLLLTFRSEASPTTGPELSVRYTPVPEPGATAGLLAGTALLTWLQRGRRRIRGHWPQRDRRLEDFDEDSQYKFLATLPSRSSQHQQCGQRERLHHSGSRLGQHHDGLRGAVPLFAKAAADAVESVQCAFQPQLARDLRCRHREVVRVDAHAHTRCVDVGHLPAGRSCDLGLRIALVENTRAVVRQQVVQKRRDMNAGTGDAAAEVARGDADRVGLRLVHEQRVQAGDRDVHTRRRGAGKPGVAVEVTAGGPAAARDAVFHQCGRDAIILGNGRAPAEHERQREPKCPDRPCDWPRDSRPSRPVRPFCFAPIYLNHLDSPM
jgi:hypothetical protein